VLGELPVLPVQPTLSKGILENLTDLSKKTEKKLLDENTQEFTNICPGFTARDKYLSA
jgi:hypothetical protein